MYGHADVGCVHVRPMLDMRATADRDLIRVISDDVANLCQRQGGLIWGEHGKGVRGEYVRQYMGDELYALMARIVITSYSIHYTKLYEYRTREEARADLFEYIEVFYNRKRRHGYLVV